MRLSYLLRILEVNILVIKYLLIRLNIYYEIKIFKIAILEISLVVYLLICVHCRKPESPELNYSYVIMSG